MKTNLMMDFKVDKENNQIRVERDFAAPLKKVWAAWTESELLDKWWAPKPYTSKTKKMDFREGGYWLYAMVSPDGEESWARADYKSITPHKSFSLQDAFCDKEGKIDMSFPRAQWKNDFIDKGETTRVSMVISYEKTEDLEKYIEMGFKEGFTAGLENLDALLS